MSQTQNIYTWTTVTHVNGGASNGGTTTFREVLAISYADALRQADGAGWNSSVNAYRVS